MVFAEMLSFIAGLRVSISPSLYCKKRASLLDATEKHIERNENKTESASAKNTETRGKKPTSFRLGDLRADISSDILLHYCDPPLQQKLAAVCPAARDCVRSDVFLEQPSGVQTDGTLLKYTTLATPLVDQVKNGAFCAATGSLSSRTQLSNRLHANLTALKTVFNQLHTCAQEREKMNQSFDCHLDLFMIFDKYENFCGVLGCSVSVYVALWLAKHQLQVKSAISQVESSSSEFCFQIFVVLHKVAPATSCVFGLIVFLYAVYVCCQCFQNQHNYKAFLVVVCASPVCMSAWSVCGWDFSDFPYLSWIANSITYVVSCVYESVILPMMEFVLCGDVCQKVSVLGLGFGCAFFVLGGWLICVGCWLYCCGG
eukprot:GDKI01029562.1.p1 GENE.GDKI01029562.1~~GDKI01029562.1.p1  ORF type:complete len:371 (-),score=20.71 GDKI01029562.1:332-1444(-)